MSVTPLKAALNALILALNDSAKALVALNKEVQDFIIMLVKRGGNNIKTLKTRVVHFVIPACKRESCCIFDGILGKYHS